MPPAGTTLEKVIAEYNDLAARVKRGTTPNLTLDLNRLRELAALIETLQARERGEG